MKRIAALMFALIMLLSCSAMAEQEGPGYSRLTPAGVGDRISHTMTSKKVEFDIEIELKDMARGAEADELMKKYQIKPPYDYEAFPGDDFLFATFDVSCTSADPDAPLELTYFSFYAYTEGGQEYKYIYVTQNRYTFPTIYSGGSCEMCVAIPVPANEKAGLLFDRSIWFYDDAQME